MNPRDQWPQRERSRSDEMAAVLSTLNILNAHEERRPRLTAVPKASLLKQLAAVGTPAGSPCGDDAQLDAADIQASQAARAERRTQEYSRAIEEATTAVDAAQNFLNSGLHMLDAKSAARAYDNIDKLKEKVAYYQKHNERLKEAMRSYHVQSGRAVREHALLHYHVEEVTSRP